DSTLQWIINGPPSKDWKKEPHRPFINLEPPYENHIAYQSKKRHTAETVRRAIYWSLLVAPTAGVTYGGHGGGGWEDGTKPPSNPNLSSLNPRTGERQTPVRVVSYVPVEFATPGEGDWVLVLRSAK